MDVIFGFKSIKIGFNVFLIYLIFMYICGMNS